MNGLRILLAEKWVDKVIKIVRVCNSVVKWRLILDKLTITFISAHVPQSGMVDEQKVQFYEVFLQTISMINDKDLVIIAGDLNGYLG